MQYNEALLGVNVSINNFRKSEQWVALQRKHAQIIVDEYFIAEKFHQLNIKFPDEHYIPTVLATHQLSSETSCGAGVTYTNWHWWKKPRHPKVRNVQYLNIYPHSTFNLSHFMRSFAALRAIRGHLHNFKIN